MKMLERIQRIKALARGAKDDGVLDIPIDTVIRALEHLEMKAKETQGTNLTGGRDMTATVAVNDFVRRQTKESSFSYFEGSEAVLIELVTENLDKKTPGFVPGSFEVPVPPQGFYSSVVTLEAGDALIGKFEPRAEGEKPVKTMRALKGEKVPAGQVQVIVYDHATLLRDKQNSTDADFEIASINATLDPEKSPLTPEALDRNHFGEDGGTPTCRSAEEYVEQHKISRAYWYNKANLADDRSREEMHQLLAAQLGLSVSP